MAMDVKSALSEILGKPILNACVLVGDSETMILRNAAVKCFIDQREDQAAGVVRKRLAALRKKAHVYS